MASTKTSIRWVKAQKKVRRRKRILRHVGVLSIGAAAFIVFWQTRQAWSTDMRLWKAVGDVAFILLWLTVLIGPVAKLWKPGRRLLPWRRPLGIWFAIAASVRAALIFNGWARWSVTRFMGYEFIPELGRTARWEPGFGLLA